MYTYGMYRLTDMTRQEILERLRQKVAHPVEPVPAIDGCRPDLASRRRVYFAAENADSLALAMASVRTFASHGREVVLAVPEALKDPAAEAWDYLPAGERERVRILLLPPLPSRENTC